jgi:hypothetical protein
LTSFGSGKVTASSVAVGLKLPEPLPPPLHDSSAKEARRRDVRIAGSR